MIDNGADAVVGGHPHVTQDIEVYKGKPIFYSLGNFVFDGFSDDDTRTGWLLRITLASDGSMDWRVREAKIDTLGVPRPGRMLRADHFSDADPVLHRFSTSALRADYFFINSRR